VDTLTARTMAPLGASQDLFLRALQPVLAERFGVSLEIDNASGQDGAVAARRVKADPPDGRHVLVTTPATLTFYPQTGDVGFESADFDPLIGVGRYNFVVITGGSQPWADLHGALAHVRREGRPLRHAGTGQPDLLMVSAMARSAGVEVELLARNGPALLETVTSGEADVGLGTGTHQPLLADGRVRVVAQLHPRAKAGSGPTPQDFGVGATLDNFILISAPRGVAPDDRARLVTRLAEAVAAAPIQTLLTERLLMEPGLLQGEELAVAIEAQAETFASLRAQMAAPPLPRAGEVESAQPTG
jgi:tripartite-type tricarboxylate transporter receptor subunit TctC